MIKLHLGCGQKFLEGWLNIDKIPCKSAVVVDDVATLDTVQDGSADLIYACHVLEHFGRHEVESVLSCWNRKLKNGGRIRIAVPDFEAVCKRYLEKREIREVTGFICGGQRNEHDYHKMIFDFESLGLLLQKSGFEQIVRYDWRETDHAWLDDYSQSYLPHMQKETGMLMSLNVEATKINKQREIDV
jgi:predicted SAM-dependent methyltransferase